MIHVFTESNWVVDVCAPGFRRVPAALMLLDRAARHEITLHVPSICFREAESAIRRKHAPVEHANLQKFRKWAAEHQLIDARESSAANEFLTRFSNSVSADLVRIHDRINEVSTSPGLDVFALSDAMLERAIALRTEVKSPQLKAFDEAILAAVLVRAGEIRDGAKRLFCTLDRDLAPTLRDHHAPDGLQHREHLESVYERAGLEFRTDFNLDDLFDST